MLSFRCAYLTSTREALRNRMRMASACAVNPSASASNAACGPSARIPCRRILLHGNQLHEIIHAQSAAHARHSARGQRVIRPGDVVAHRLRRPSAHKHRARVLHPLQIVRRIHGQMLGRQAIRDFARFLECLLRRSRRRFETRASRATAFRGFALWPRRSPASPDLARVVTKIASASGSCSACATRSAAISRGSPRSLVTTISVGPASMSIAQSNATSRLAAVTYRLPGPTILSTRAIARRAVSQRGNRVCAAYPIELRDAEQMRRRQRLRAGFGETTTIRSTPRPAPESPSSAASKAADAARSAHSIPPMRAAAQAGRP